MPAETANGLPYPLDSDAPDGAAQIKALAEAIDQIPSALIADLAVIEAKLGNASVATAKLIDLAVTTVKLANEAVTEAKLGNLAVATGKLANLAVTAAKLGNESVETGKLQALAVTTAKLAANAVETAKIKDGAVTRAKIAAASGLQTKRVEFEEIAAQAALTVTVVWPTAFADTEYTVSLAVFCSTIVSNQGLSVVSITEQTKSQIKVSVRNNQATGGRVGTLHATAWHD